MSLWLMWLIVKLDTINGVCIAFTVFGGAATMFSTIIGFVHRGCNEQHQAKTAFTFGKYFAYPMAILGLVGVLIIPTTKEAAAIYILPQLLQNKSVQQLPIKVVDLANEWLDYLKPNTKEK